MIFMLIGSSMTQRAFSIADMGFAIGLSDWYSRLADVIVRGQNGYNSRWTLMSFPELISGYKPDMVALFLGNNDALPFPSHSLSADEFRDNLHTLLSMLREEVNKDMTILLLTPTRAASSRRTDQQTFPYVEVVRDAEALHSLNAVVELWDGDYAITTGADLLKDGMHLNKRGNNKVCEAIKSTIRTRFPHFVPFNDSIGGTTAGGTVRLRYDTPEWMELAGKSVEECREIFAKKRSDKLQ